MNSHLLQAGISYVLLLGLLAALPQAWQARPPGWLRLAMGLAFGLTSLALTLYAMGTGAADGPRSVHPTLIASAAFLWGPLAGAVAAATALGGTLVGMPADWTSGLSVALGSAALGILWRLLLRRARVGPWTAVLGLAVTVPPVVSVWALPEFGRGLAGHDWLPGGLPWRYVMGVFLLSGGASLLRGRARMLLALAQREEELLGALRATGGGRWEWDVREQRLSYGGSLYRRFGLADSPDDDAPALAQMLARSRHCRRWSLERHHPEDLRRLAPYLARVLAGQEASVQAEYRIRDDQGRWRWVIARGRAVQHDASGRVLRLAGMDLDITEQREHREALKASETKYTTIYQTLPDAAGITRLEDGRYIDVNPAFERLIRLPSSSILGRTSLELGIWSGEEERQRVLQALATHGEVRGLPVTVHRTGEAVDGLMSARTAQVDGQECLVFVFHDLTQERHVRQELLAANRLLREAGWMARLGVWEEVPGKGLSYWSDVCFHIHGLEPGSPLPHNYVDTYVLPEWRAQVREQLRLCLHERSTWQTEMQIQHADGRQLWVRARGEPVVEGGRVVRIRGILQDIDEVRRATERLRASEERLARVFHLLPSPLGFSRRSDGTYLDVNPAWEQAVGYTREQTLGRSSIELGICTPEVRSAMMGATGGSELVGHEMEITIASGERRTILQSLSPIDLHGEECWLFVLHDITERKQTEQRVREREELLSLTIAAATLGLWDCDLAEGTISGDARWRELLGLPAQEPSAPLPWSLALAQADMLEVARELARHKAHPAVPFDVTLQGITTGQGRRWVRSLGKIVAWSDAGEPLRMVGMSIDVSSQRTQEQQLERMAHYDALTGLPNRVLLERRLQDGMRASRAGGTHLGVGYLDLDGFKPVNDRLGHATGDRLLVMVAQRLQQALRPGDCVARLGGDEFVVLLPALASGGECEERLRALMDSVAAPYPLDGERVVVTASIGYTLYPDDGADADALLRHADQAMYAAKQAGRNRYHAFDAAHERERQARQGACARLAQAIAAGELALYLQPKVDMRRGTTVGAEALVRWNHPEKGLLAPGQFLQLLDGHDALQQAFGQWVVDEALALIGRLAGRVGRPLPVSVNITPEHLHSPGFADWMLQRMARHPELPAHLLQLELTESAALYDIDHAARELARLRAVGVGIAFDDFGTGYSSLAYLRRLPVDHLKLDRSFVTGMLHDAGDRAIVQGVIGLSRSFGCEVIAEGVETVEQGRMLLAMGCTLAQGYCIARPMALDEFAAWARQWQAPAQWLDAATAP
ncbi:EAL domain-containing protein [Pulveribacter suum]|uniref:GGDEF domain-containing protein n=1 Tax=Pulveribacter suum TaxID=2116657 RepID=A0A2P1NL83_9BURK|nr:EAL domain-containing protein [Pulveribacter suum]AVP57815.1 GGDEF domain-containing protein [Pulveribacter suum]